MTIRNLYNLENLTNKHKKERSLVTSNDNTMTTLKMSQDPTELSFFLISRFKLKYIHMFIKSFIKLIQCLLNQKNFQFRVGDQRNLFAKMAFQMRSEWSQSAKIKKRGAPEHAQRL